MPLFVNYAAQMVPVIGCHSGEIRQTPVFVAVLRASIYTLAETAWSQQLPDWLGSHARCFVFLGGILEIVVLDNLRSVVSKARRYEPDLTPATAAWPGTTGWQWCPRLRSACSGGVLDPRRLEEPSALLPGRTQHGHRRALGSAQPASAQELPVSRQSAFENLDRTALRPLPE